MDIKNNDNRFIANTYARFPVQISTGSGSLAFDENGKRYIDFGSGIAVNTFGFCDPVWQNAIFDQTAKLQHTSNLYYTEPCTQLAQMLSERTGMKKAFFSNSGAEANECAIKTARRRAFMKYGEGHHTIITLKNSFHGRTITTLSATGQDSFHTEFGPFTDGFVYADVNDIASVKKLADENACAAIMIELIQGESGVNKLEQDFVDGIVALAKEKDILIIADEVQTGNGRTGELFAFMHYGFMPDIVTTAKGLAGGLPLGATLFGEKTENVLTPGSHGSTFGGNPICCAAAISVLERIDDALLSDVKEKSAYIINTLSGAKGVVSVSGMGLMLGIETKRDAKDIISECMQKGVLVLSAKNKVRILPALNIPMQELQEAVQILLEVISK